MKYVYQAMVNDKTISFHASLTRAKIACQTAATELYSNGKNAIGWTRCESDPSVLFFVPTMYAGDIPGDIYKVVRHPLED